MDVISRIILMVDMWQCYLYGGCARVLSFWQVCGSVICIVEM